LTVDAWIVADEAARLSNDLISALRPMRARRPHTRLAMLSTAWSLADPFWTAWSSEDPSWIRLRATADVNPNFNPKFLEQEDTLSVRRPSNANISASRRVRAPVRSPGFV